MINDKILGFIDKNYYMIAIFDSANILLNKNEKFDEYFKNIEKYQDFNIISDDTIENIKRIYVVSDFIDGVVKFEVINYEDYTMVMGIRLDYHKLMEMMNHVQKEVVDCDETKIISFNKNKTKSYCTFIVDTFWVVKYFSDNVYDILNIKNPYLKKVDDIFGTKFLNKIKEKLDYLDVFNDLCLEYDDKLVVITKSEYSYILINVYPYSNNVYNTFEEVSHLKYKIEQLENELKRRKELINFQKDMIKSLSHK